MKSLITKAMALAGICTALVSFAAMPGGEGFEILLNNKVIVQKFGTDVTKTESMVFSQQSPGDQLIVKYYHCGKAGKNRIIAVKNDHDKILKEFLYGDASTGAAGMSLKLKDIITLKKGNNPLKLFYSSSELPNGRVLVSF